MRITAVRKLAVEAADNGLLAPELANEITRVKGVASKGIRLGNWCIPQIRSAAGSRHVKPQTRYFDERFGRSKLDGHEKSTGEIGDQEEVSLVPGKQTSTRIQSRNWGRGPLRLGCAPLVAVMKPADLRNGNDGAAIRRVHRPRLRRVLG